jgi:dihydroorotase
MNRIRTSQNTYSFKTHIKSWRALAAALLFLTFLMPFDSLLAQGRGGQPNEILLKGGHVIDPKNGINGIMDVSIVAGKIARMATGIIPGSNAIIVDAKGLYVTPGLIDIHAHAFWGPGEGTNYSNGALALQPDGFTLRAGVTTIVDAGGAGWRNFEIFKKQTIDRATTRVLSILNISGAGMDGSPNEGGNLGDMDAQKTGEMGKKYPEIIVGVKHAHWGRNNPVPAPGPDDYIIPIKRGIEAAGIMGGYFMLDGTFSEITAPLFRAGDVFTHLYTGSLIDEKTGKIKSHFAEAQKRGVIFDVGHGGGAFKYANAIPAIKQGFVPHTISSDLHSSSMNSGMKDMSNLMSKFMAMGLSLQDVVQKSTWNPANVIKRPELGNLSVGSVADVAVFRVMNGEFGFLDTSRTKITGKQKLVAELTIRAGRVVWDLNGMASPLTPALADAR